MNLFIDKASSSLAVDVMRKEVALWLLRFEGKETDFLIHAIQNDLQRKQFKKKQQKKSYRNE